MANNNSTALKQDASLPVSYSDFSCEFSYQLFRVKAMVAGARSMVYESERNFTQSPELLDAAYLLDDVVERIKQLAADLSSTEFKYQQKESGA